MKITAALMLKAPRPGTVKTRLAKAIGNETATSIYRSLAERQVTQIPNDWRCAIHFAPADAVDEMRGWLGSVAPADAVYRPQCQGDLGDRMRHAVQAELAADADAVVLLGGDCPDIDTAVLRDVAKRLAVVDVVIAPAFDGGYVLLALKADHAGLFADIAWSTPQVLDQTLVEARRSGLSVAITDTYQDIDDLASARTGFPSAFRA